MTTDASTISEKLIQNTLPYLIDGEGGSYFVDPVFNIVRNRVNAEMAKSLFRMGYTKEARKIIPHLISNQNPDGSWNEIHPNYCQPSALVTSFVADAILVCDNEGIYSEPVSKGKDYILSQEDGSGYFVKSKMYTADCLNVNASCGAFLAKYGSRYDDEECLNAAYRAFNRVCNLQLTDGSFPYTSDKGSYKYTLDIPCIHYQGVTLYYLIKINTYLENEELSDSIRKGVEWLAKQQKKDGRFDWTSSGLLFASYLSGAYAFAYSCFKYLSDEDSSLNEAAEIALKMIDTNQNNIMYRWEKDSWNSFPSSLMDSIEISKIGNYPSRHKFFRLAYSVYRNIARRRIRPKIDDSIFNIVNIMLNLDSSTIEPFNNFPDMFMTSETLDCLTFTLEGF